MRLFTSELVKKYKARTVVNHVSIDVNQGEIVGLLGPNGAGGTFPFRSSRAPSRRDLERFHRPRSL